MFSRSIRSSLRPAVRSVSTSTRAQPTQRFARNAVIAASTVAVAGFALTQERSRVYNDSVADGQKVEIKSVLDQPTLKQNLRKDDHSSSAKKSAASSTDPAPEILTEKKQEAEESSQSAYNPETGEINWDCPCLGGMADGPCGPQFKEAFSCFIYSEAEPKGIDCVEKFKGMQDCFREHPDIYGEEIADDEDETPLSEDGKIEGKPLPAGHPDQDKVPKAPNAEPPKSSKIPDLTHENQMSKGVQKLQPKGNRADKKGVTQPGDGTA